MKPKAITTYKVTHTNLERFLNKKYGIEFDFKKATGRAYPDCVEYVVTGKLSDPLGVRHQIARARKGRCSRNAAILLNLLCADGFIPAGKYVVKVERVIDYQGWYLKLLEQYGVDSPECLEFQNTHSQVKPWCEMVDRSARQYLETISLN